MARHAEGDEVLQPIHPLEVIEQPCWADMMNFQVGSPLVPVVVFGTATGRALVAVAFERALTL
jgi:hypothetical protein